MIEKPKTKGQRYGEKAAAKRGRSHKERLRQTIDRVLPGCKDFEEFLSRMRAEGYEVKRRGKSLEFRDQDQERFTRSFRLGEAYTEEGLRERIIATDYQERKTGKAGNFAMEEPKPARLAAAGKKQRRADKNVNLLVDIETKMQAGPTVSNSWKGAWMRRRILKLISSIMQRHGRFTNNIGNPGIRNSSVQSTR